MNEDDLAKLRKMTRALGRLKARNPHVADQLDAISDDIRRILFKESDCITLLNSMTLSVAAFWEQKEPSDGQIVSGGPF